MRRASIAALKARLSEYVDAAKAGEEVIVTDRNKPVARLGPVSAPVRGEAQLIGLIRAGLARPAVRALPAGVLGATAAAGPSGACAGGAYRGTGGRSVRFWDASALVPLVVD